MKTAYYVKYTFLKTVFLDFKEITKAGLAISVLFSSIAGYFLGLAMISFSMVCLIMLAIGVIVW
jgi:protoheme IX farnesyltransferase